MVRMQSRCKRLTRLESCVVVEACSALLLLSVVLQLISFDTTASSGADGRPRERISFHAPQNDITNNSGRFFANPSIIGASSRRMLQDTVGSGCIPVIPLARTMCGADFYGVLSDRSRAKGPIKIQMTDLPLERPRITPRISSNLVKHTIVNILHHVFVECF